MKKILLPIFLFCFIFFAFGQTPMTVRLSDSLLHTGKFKVAITTFDYPLEIKELQNKTLKNLKANPKWADKYIIVQVQKGDKEIPKFIDDYGLTSKEFEIMIEGFRKGKISFFKDTFQLKIDKNNNVISFQSSEKLTFLNYLKIDIKHNKIFFDNLKMTKELLIPRGKFYSPNLNGMETFSSEQMDDIKSKLGFTYFGFSIGVDKKNAKTSLCLITGKGSLEEPKFLNITIL